MTSQPRSPRTDSGCSLSTGKCSYYLKINLSHLSKFTIHNYPSVCRYLTDDTEKASSHQKFTPYTGDVICNDMTQIHETR